MRTAPLVTLAALAAFAAGVEAAQVATPNAAIGEAPVTAGQSENFTTLDRNRDGAIDRDEAKRSKNVARQFEVLDTVKDDKLSPAEFSVMEADYPDHSTRP